MHCGQLSLMVRYGRDRYGTGAIEGNTTPSPVPYHQTQLATYSCPQYSNTVKAIILTMRIYIDFPKLTSLRVPKVTILTHSQRSVGQYNYVSISV